MGLRPTHGDESRVFRRRLIPNELRRDLRRRVIACLLTLIDPEPRLLAPFAAH